LITWLWLEEVEVVVLVEAVLVVFAQERDCLLLLELLTP
jgi:hypothetical protein